MQLHANAALTVEQRRRMVRRVCEQGWPVTKAAEAAEVSGQTARKWVRRYLAEGDAGLVDRSSAPRRVANRTPPSRVQAIVALRRLRFTGPQIAELLDMPDSTVSGLLKELGMGRLGRLGLEPAARYERQRPGELIHIDVKKLGRIARPGHRIGGSRAAEGYHRRAFNQGFEFVHVAIDDATRLAYAEVLSDEKATTATGFLRRAMSFFASYRIDVERVMTDG